MDLVPGRDAEGAHRAVGGEPRGLAHDRSLRPGAEPGPSGREAEGRCPAAQAGPARGPCAVETAQTAPEPGRHRRGGERGTPGAPGSTPDGTHERFAVRVSPGGRRGHGLGSLPHPGERHPGVHRRRRPHQQLRLLRQPPAGRHRRLERLRRGHDRALGVGPEAAGGERQRRRTRERHEPQGAAPGGPAGGLRLPLERRARVHDGRAGGVVALRLRRTRAEGDQGTQEGLVARPEGGGQGEERPPTRRCCRRSRSGATTAAGVSSRILPS